MSLETIGNKLRRIRQKKELSLRIAADMAGIDVSILSKMERGERKLSKELVQKLARIYNYDSEKLLLSYLSSKLVNELKGEHLALPALKEAAAKVSSIPGNFTNNAILKKKIKSVLKMDVLKRPGYLALLPGEKHRIRAMLIL